MHGSAAAAHLHSRAASFRALHDSLANPGHAAPSLADSIHPAQGTSFTALAGSGGATATQSVSPSLTVNEGSTTIYTPTLYPAGGSCIEVTTAYWSGQRSVAAWDWCNNINFQAFVTIDSNFLATYGNGNNAYSVDIEQTDAGSNTWTAWLYNYQAGSWQQFYQSAGSSQAGTSGWDVYELYSSTDPSTGNSFACADMAGQTFEASGIQVRINGSWQAAGSGNAGTGYDQPHSAFECPDMTYGMVNNYDHWRAVG
ncbi:MAG: hypothetical protein WCA46_08955 [Actinocatenispora sp.]